MCLNLKHLFISIYLVMKKITDQELAKFLNMDVRTINQKLKRNNRSLEKGDYELKSTGKKGHPQVSYSKEFVLNSLRSFRSMKISYKESAMEEFLKNNLPIVEEGLSLVAVQFSLGKNHRPDIIAKDKQGRSVVIELQVGALDKNHLYRSLEYRDLFYLNHNVKPRVMVIAETVSKEYRQICKIHRVEISLVREVPEFATVEKSFDYESMKKRLEVFFNE